MQSFHTPAPITVTVRLSAGDVTVDAVETEETEVDLRDTGDEASQQAVAQARIELRGSELIVDVPRIRGGFLRGEAEVSLRIRCPRRSSLELQTRSADVAVRGRLERAEATTVSGDLFVDEAGRASVRTTSGDIRIERCGDLDANSTSGDIQVLDLRGRAGVKSVSGDLVLGDVHGQVTANTVSGDQRIEGAVEGELTLHAVSGDVMVGIRRGSRVWVDARSLGGDTSSELDLADVPAPEGEGPLVELRVTTISGDVVVRRAAAPAAA
jgi:DUF4097 and DUF4098 domain-containing protein YvlB